MENEKPDAWVCWHLEYGFDLETVSYKSEDTVWYNKIYSPDLLFSIETSFDDGLAFNKKNAIAAGWRVRPVKLVFLDKEIVTEAKDGRFI